MQFLLRAVRSDADIAVSADDEWSGLSTKVTGSEVVIRLRIGIISERVRIYVDAAVDGNAPRRDRNMDSKVAIQGELSVGVIDQTHVEIGCGRIHPEVKIDVGCCS